MSDYNKKYHAFISYKHDDNKESGRQWASWLHHSIETYQVPSDLVGEVNTKGKAIPARIYPIFRDEDELPADADLGKAIVGALDDSRQLIVLCSPRAVASTYVADEIDYFKKQGNSERIIAVMIDGEPNTSWNKAQQSRGFKVEDECFPVPLQFEYNKSGNRTQNRAEPIAADFRVSINGEKCQGWTSPAAFRLHLTSLESITKDEIEQLVSDYQAHQHLMLLKVIAAILDVPLGELTQRDKEYQLQQERLKAKKLRRWLGAVTLLAVIAVGLGIFAYSKQKIAEQEQRVSNKVTSYFIKIFKGADPEFNRGKQILASHILERVAKGIAIERFESDKVKSRIIVSVAHSLAGIGKYDEAIMLVDKNKSLLEESINENSESSFVMSLSLADISVLSYDLEKSRDTFEKLLSKSVAANNVFYMAEANIGLGEINLAENKYEAAIKNFKQALQHGKGNVPIELKTYFGMADAKAAMNGNESASKLFEELYQRSNEYYGKVHTFTIDVANSLAVNYYLSHKLEKAKEILKEARASAKLLFGQSHPEYIAILGNIGRFQIESGFPSDAKHNLLKVLAVDTQYHSVDNYDIVYTYQNLALSEFHLNEYKEAKAHLHLGLEIAETMEHDLLGTINAHLAEVYCLEGENDKCESYINSAIKIIEKHSGNKHWRYFLAQNIRTKYLGMKKGFMPCSESRQQLRELLTDPHVFVKRACQ